MISKAFGIMFCGLNRQKWTSLESMQIITSVIKLIDVPGKGMPDQQ